MIEYKTREEAENDPELNLMIIWQCDRCKIERKDYPRCNEGGKCSCGGWFREIGESHNAVGYWR